MSVRTSLALSVAATLLVIAAGVTLARPDHGRQEAARAAATRFLDRYVEADGRVVRHDQGGDTVSEGQAYALLLAAAVGDERRFGAVWLWTHKHLERSDGLLAWHWDDGRVVDDEPATDADLDAARALLLAARRFGRADYERAARRLGRALREHATVDDVLVAGPWARTDGVINPSYLSPRAFAALGWDGGRTAAGRVLDGLPDALPPDWAKLDAGSVTPIGSPGSRDAPRYGYDAMRMPLRFAESCQAGDRRLAARAWPLLRGRDPLPAVLGLDGAAQGPQSHPAALAGAAGAAAAAGDNDAAGDLLDRAGALDERSPSYYGAAWVALGRVMLDTELLGACR